MGLPSGGGGAGGDDGIDSRGFFMFCVSYLGAEEFERPDNLCTGGGGDPHPTRLEGVHPGVVEVVVRVQPVEEVREIHRCALHELLDVHHRPNGKVSVKDDWGVPTECRAAVQCGTIVGLVRDADERQSFEGKLPSITASGWSDIALFLFVGTWRVDTAATQP